MLRGILTLSGIMCLSALLACGQGAGEAGSLAAARTLIDQYCVACHNQTQKTAGLMSAFLRKRLTLRGFIQTECVAELMC